jgi:GWxTD domain-containing protein
MRGSYFIVVAGLLLTILLCNCAGTNLNLDKKEADKLFLEAKKDFEDGKLDSAEVKVKKLIDANPNLACAYNLLGEIYRKEGGLRNRVTSAQTIKKAIELEPLNPTYHYNLGLTYLEQDFREYAIDEFKKAAELDSSYIEPWLRMGDAHRQHAIIYDDKTYYDKASECYKQALSIDSLNGEALYNSALVLSQKRNYNAARTMLDKIKEGSFDPEKVCLLYGYLDNKTGYYYRAEEYYNKALTLMSPEEREVYFDVALLLSEEQKKEYSRLDDEGKMEFREILWRSIDPDPSTEVNERKLEHYSRIVYADINFSVPHLKVRGALSDRGKVCTKFGEPDFRYYETGDFRGGVWSDSFKFLGYGLGSNTLALSRDIPSKWHWSYSNQGSPFTLTFENRFKNNDYIIPYSEGSSGTEGDFTSFVIRSVSAVTPQIHAFDYGGELLRCLYQVYQFRGKENKTKVSVVYAIPNSELKFVPLGKFGQAYVDEKYIVSDLEGQKVEGDINKKGFLVPSSQTLDSNLLVTNLFSFDLPLGDYQLAWSLKDSTSKKITVLKLPLEVDDFRSDSLGLSSIILADKIKVDSKGDFVRQNYSISPNFNNTFYAHQNPEIYYEIYNLKKDWEGKTYYRSECAVVSLKKGKRGKTERMTTVSQSLEGRGINTEEVETFSLSLMDAKPGEYELVIKVSDLNSKISKERKCRFRLIKRK